MPVNARKHEMQCWSHIYGVYTKLAKRGKTMEFDELVHQCIRGYPVSVDQVERHVKRFYIVRGLLNVREGVLSVPPISSNVEVLNEELRAMGVEVQS
jgi:hypothetical protein